MTNAGRTKLTIVGAGSVGTSTAYAALIRGSADEITLYDIAEKKVVAEVKDLAHGTQFTPTHHVNGGADIAVTKNSDVVVITAGAKQKPGQTRLDLAGANVSIMRSLLPQLLEQSPDAIYVLVTNPADVITAVAQKISGLPLGRVLSTGTMLETARVRWLIGELSGVATSSVHAMIMGEHGDTKVPIWSSATIGHTPVRDWTDEKGVRLFSEETLADIAHQVARAAYEIIEGKGATNYAIGVTTARLVEAILNDQHTILPVSSLLTDYRGIKDTALSVPSVVGRAGVLRVLDMPMDAQEITMLRRSSDTLSELLRSLGF